MKKVIITIGFVVILITSAILTNVSAFEINLSSDDSWTIMLYLDGDNDLEYFAVDDFLEISSVGSTADVNLLIQFDRIHYYGGYDDSRYGDWASTKRFYVTQGMEPTPGAAVQDIGETNMGDPQTVIDFANWAMTSYPADNYCLIFWDHGSGWKDDPDTPRKYVCLDETNGDYLQISELRNAFTIITNGGNNKIDLIGFDACLMGMIEVAYEINDYGNYMTASEETEPGDGWNYEDALHSLITSPGMSGEVLGAQFVAHYEGHGITLSTIDLGRVDFLTDAVNNFAIALQNQEYRNEIKSAIETVESYADYDYVDLYHFAELIQYNINGDIDQYAQQVLFEVGNSVTSEKHDYEHRNSHGISIYIPYYYFEQVYKELLFAYYSQWDEFLEWLFEDPTSNPPTDPKISGPTEGLSGSTYYYSFVSTDPDGDKLEYYIDWGDGTEWLGPENPGTEIEAYHSWMADGAYIIKAKAYDSNGAESDWTYYTITMPKEKDTQDKFIEILLERVFTFLPFLKQFF